MNAQKHGELANFIWGICNLLRGPYKRNSRSFLRCFSWYLERRPALSSFATP